MFVLCGIFGQKIKQRQQFACVIQCYKPMELAMSKKFYMKANIIVITVHLFRRFKRALIITESKNDTLIEKQRQNFFSEVKCDEIIRLGTLSFERGYKTFGLGTATLTLRATLTIGDKCIWKANGLTLLQQSPFKVCINNFPKHQLSIFPKPNVYTDVTRIFYRKKAIFSEVKWASTTKY